MVKATKLLVALVLTVGVVLVPLATPKANAATSDNFTEHVLTANLNNPYSIFAIDVDGDGDTDLVSGSSFRVCWYENDSSGNFTQHYIIAVVSSAFTVYPADVDSDGDIDILYSTVSYDKVAWLENDGSQNFTEHVVTTAVDGASSVRAADMDGDGDIDVVSSSLTDDKIAWYENDGSQNFAAHTVSTNADQARTVHAADVDGDGDMDLMSASEIDNKIAWYENDGSQNFTEHVVTTAAVGAYYVHAADVDSDGDMDLMSASSNDNRIAWYENDGSQNFTTHTVSTTADQARSVYAADVDNDGDMDLMAASVWEDKIAWYENDGSQNFTIHTISTVDTYGQSVYAADLDSDGDMDLVSASAADDKITWYENLTIHCSASFPQETVISHVPDRPEAIYAADVDNDGDIDLMSASYLDDRIAWYENTAGDGSAWTQHTVSTSAEAAMSVYAADVDGDGDIDLISASSNDDKVAWYENTAGDGSAWTEHVVTTNADSAQSVYAADVDGDGDVDLMAALYLNEIVWYENDGTQNFTGHTVSTNADGAQSVYAADVDSDGDIDLMSASFIAITIEDRKVTWYENNTGDGSTWVDHIISTNASGVHSVYATDVDGDGDIDLMSASMWDDKIAWYENDSAQNFTDHTVSTNANGAYSVYATDVDGDGDIDLMSASVDDDHVAWYENRGGQFSLATANTAPASLVQGQTDDLLKITATHRGRNSDGDMELATLELLFEESASDSLTTAEAEAIIANLYIYLDDGSGIFESDADTLVHTTANLSLTGGVQTVTFSDSDASVQVAYGTPKTYFVVTELTADATSQTPDQFRVTHITASSSTAEDRTYDLPLSLEYTPDTASTVVTATYPPPAITSFNPTSAATGASVVITGDNFTAATAVTFGGTAAAGFTVDSDNQVTAEVAGGSSGNIAVITPGGTATNSGFTYIAPASGGSGGGGGGGGGSGITSFSGSISGSGRFVSAFEAESTDGKVTVTIPKDTVGRNRVGQPLANMTIREKSTPPPPPADANVIGLTYDFGPAGATFEPPISVVLEYEEDLLPESVSEGNLKIANWDETLGEWVVLECVVDTEANTITAQVSHFSLYTIISTPQPATFSLTDLAVEPAEIGVGETANISVFISNTGDLGGCCPVIFSVNGEVIEEREVTLDANSSEIIFFEETGEKAGKYSFSINDFAGEYTVISPAQELEMELSPPVTTPKTETATTIVPEPAPTRAEVTTPPAPKPEPAPTPLSQEPANNWLLVGIIVAIGAVLVIYLVYRFATRRD